MPTVLITGGARRIGRSLALRFAEHGYSVGFTYHSSPEKAASTLKDLTQIGVIAEMHHCNVTVESELHLALETLSKRLGVPDVIVSNAGIFPPRRAIEDLTQRVLHETFDVNTAPLLNIAKSYMQIKPKSADHPGKIVSISSLGALEIWKERIDYNVSKASLVVLVKALARMLAPYIVINSVAPGAIKLADEPSEAERELVALQKIPVGRYGTADDIFDAVWFFATCSPYITGQVVSVDGGLSLTH
ncbi:MAG: SDR family oxidoreductase [Ignavibacteria bacterium]|nr:SDR family oxidoreductase [Ignavibacteria bacterium]